MARDEGPDERALVKLYDSKFAIVELHDPKTGKHVLPPRYRAALRLQAGTGWHVTELVRWLELGGHVEEMPLGREHEAAAVRSRLQGS